MLLALIYDFYDLPVVVIGVLMFVVFVILCCVSNKCKGPFVWVCDCSAGVRRSPAAAAQCGVL